MEVSRKERAQDRLSRGKDIAFAPDEADAFAASDLAARARDRRLQQTQPERGHPLADARDAIGIAGAGTEHELARILPTAGSSSRSTTASTCSVLKTASTMVWQLAARAATEAAGDPPCSASCSRLVRIEVVSRHRETGLEQAAGERLAQEAEPDEPNGGCAQGSGAMPRSRATASSASRSGLGMGTPFLPRSIRLR